MVTGDSCVARSRVAVQDTGLTDQDIQIARV